ncbi:MAG: ethanolamine permease [Lewinellaceae bacterium]|nr:ethanolamine permease [Saprospiraceae bacterium]MCB9333331.1 ethanolamine permease [Lewinellaceae bacterium]
MANSTESTTQLNRTLGPLMLWGLGVGYVISGMYFGWNLGLEKGGTLGLAVATFFIIILYLCFTFSYTELACAIPRAGGAFDYAMRALGKDWGFLGGMAQNIEFIFAPPAIAFAIGAYLNIFMPGVPVLAIAVFAYLVFTALNIYGVQAAASFELVITVVAVIGLLLFAGAALPAFEWQHLEHNALPNGWAGAFAALPFAIWFFLAIEGVANVAEETINPQRNVLIGFGSAILTLVALCLLTFAASVGVGGWETIVYAEAGAAPSDSPLPLALAHVAGHGHILYQMVTVIGLFGLVASFHGIILSAGRATMEFGRVGFAPRGLGRVHARFKTPANALLLNMGIGIVALFTGKTGEIITIACFGALTLYIVSMVALIKLRRQEPELERPFRVPLYPLTPVVALVIAVVAFVAITIDNLLLAGIYFGLLGVAYLWFRTFYGPSQPS